MNSEGETGLEEEKLFYKKTVTIILIIVIIVASTLTISYFGYFKERWHKSRLTDTWKAEYIGDRENYPQVDNITITFYRNNSLERNLHLGTLTETEWFEWELFANKGYMTVDGVKWNYSFSDGGDMVILVKRGEDPGYKIVMEKIG